MQEMRTATAGSKAAARLKALFAAGALALAIGGCGTAIETPLPDMKAATSTSLTQAERDKAVAELNKKRLTHEQDAEQQIEQAR